MCDQSEILFENEIYVSVKKMFILLNDIVMVKKRYITFQNI